MQLRREPPALFLSGSMAQSDYWARQMGFRRSEWRHIGRLEDVQGRRGPVVYVVGTYYGVRHSEDILDYLTAIGADVIFAEEMVPRG